MTTIWDPTRAEGNGRLLTSAKVMKTRGGVKGEKNIGGVVRHQGPRNAHGRAPQKRKAISSYH